ncbi:hypothetical protein BASA60_005813 [Batrachochytrium salamandrivorans]|nr:hypothetical protein BASA60_005813 [Batrachochytrium salamandrivorans]
MSTIQSIPSPITTDRVVGDHSLSSRELPVQFWLNGNTTHKLMSDDGLTSHTIQPLTDPIDYYLLDDVPRSKWLEQHQQRSQPSNPLQQDPARPLSSTLNTAQRAASGIRSAIKEKGAKLLLCTSSLKDARHKIVSALSPKLANLSRSTSFLKKQPVSPSLSATAPIPSPDTIQFPMTPLSPLSLQGGAPKPAPAFKFPTRSPRSPPPPRLTIVTLGSLAPTDGSSHVNSIHGTQEGQLERSILSPCEPQSTVYEDLEIMQPDTLPVWSLSNSRHINSVQTQQVDPSSDIEMTDMHQNTDTSYPIYRCILSEIYSDYDLISIKSAHDCIEACTTCTQGSKNLDCQDYALHHQSILTMDMSTMESVSCPSLEYMTACQTTTLSRVNSIKSMRVSLFTGDALTLSVRKSASEPGETTLDWVREDDALQHTLKVSPMLSLCSVTSKRADGSSDTSHTSATLSMCNEWAECGGVTRNSFLGSAECHSDSASVCDSSCDGLFSLSSSHRGYPDVSCYSTENDTADVAGDKMASFVKDGAVHVKASESDITVAADLTNGDTLLTVKTDVSVTEDMCVEAVVPDTTDINSILLNRSSDGVVPDPSLVRPTRSPGRKLPLGVKSAHFARDIAYVPIHMSMDISRKSSTCSLTTIVEGFTLADQHVRSLSF